MLKVRKALPIIPLLIFNMINFALLIESIRTNDFLDYTQPLITVFYVLLSYAVYKEWKYSSIVAVIGYFVCVWLSHTFGYGTFGFYGLHLILTVMLVMLFEIGRKQKTIIAN